MSEIIVTKTMPLVTWRHKLPQNNFSVKPMFHITFKCSLHSENQRTRFLNQRTFHSCDCAYLMNKARLGKTPYLEKING